MQWRYGRISTDFVEVSVGKCGGGGFKCGSAWKLRGSALATGCAAHPVSRSAAIPLPTPSYRFLPLIRFEAGFPIAHKSTYAQLRLNGIVVVDLQGSPTPYCRAARTKCRRKSDLKFVVDLFLSVAIDTLASFRDWIRFRYSVNPPAPPVGRVQGTCAGTCNWMNEASRRSDRCQCRKAETPYSVVGGSPSEQLR